MIVKLLGAAMILAGCGWTGFAAAAAFRHEERALQQLIHALGHMKSELEYTMAPLANVCRNASESCDGVIRRLLWELSAELDCQTASEAGSCVEAAMKKTAELPESVRRNLHRMGTGLGKFDLNGQITGLEAAEELCKRDLEQLQSRGEERIRSCRTLGLCAGAALVILLI